MRARNSTPVQRVTEETIVRGIVLACGTNLPLLPGIGEDEITRVPALPGKAHVDGALRDLDGGKGARGADVIVVGTDGDLAAVVLRLVRTERLAATTVGYVPAQRSSAVAALWGLPTPPERALELASRGRVDPVPLIRDDKGGVLLGKATVGRVRGEAYCDDTRAFRGVARRIEVSPDNRGGAGVTARVTLGGPLLRRTASFAGRAFQLGCEPVTATLDGVPQPRPANRWTWYRHTEDLRLVRVP